MRHPLRPDEIQGAHEAVPHHAAVPRRHLLLHAGRHRQLQREDRRAVHRPHAPDERPGHRARRGENVRPARARRDRRRDGGALARAGRVQAAAAGTHRGADAPWPQGLHRHQGQLHERRGRHGAARARERGGHGGGAEQVCNVMLPVVFHRDARVLAEGHRDPAVIRRARVDLDIFRLQIAVHAVRQAEKNPPWALRRWAAPAHPNRCAK